MRATEFTAESMPITAPRLFFGTHCINSIGTAGVNSGIPATYNVAAHTAATGPAPPANDSANSPAETSARPTAVVSVRPIV